MMISKVKEFNKWLKIMKELIIKCQWGLDKII